MGTLQPQGTPPRAVYHVGNRTPGVNIHSSTAVKTNNSSLGSQHTEISLSAFCGWARTEAACYEAARETELPGIE